MTVVVYIVSRFDEKERPYVSTTAPTIERQLVLYKTGYQVHRVAIQVPGVGDIVSPVNPQSALPEVIIP